MNQTTESIVELPLGLIERGFFQPREYFSPEAMEATKRSIQEKGQKYPVLVRAILAGNPLFDAAWPETHYELADGERRFRCCKELGFQTIKALVRALSDEEMLDYTLTTNDSLPLNPIEKATVFSRLAKEFGRSQADIAKSFNLKQQQISEYMRLLELPKEIQDLTARAVISVRHARELLKINDSDKMTSLAFEIQKNSISTRKLSKIMRKDEKIQENENLGLKIEEKTENKSYLKWLNSINLAFIPNKFYYLLQKWIYWRLGSDMKPELWLSRLECSLLIGIIVAGASLWLPFATLAALLGALATVLVYLYIE